MALKQSFKPFINTSKHRSNSQMVVFTRLTSTLMCINVMGYYFLLPVINQGFGGSALDTLYGRLWGKSKSINI